MSTSKQLIYEHPTYGRALVCEDVNGDWVFRPVDDDKQHATTTHKQY